MTVYSVDLENGKRICAEVTVGVAAAAIMGLRDSGCDTHVMVIGYDENTYEVDSIVEVSVSNNNPELYELNGWEVIPADALRSNEGMFAFLYSMIAQDHATILL